MSARGHVSEDPDEQAARWYGRQRSGAMSAEETHALAEWLDADPANRSAFDAVDQAWSALGAVREAPKVLAMREAIGANSAQPRTWMRRAMIASLALVVAGGAGWAGWRFWPPFGALSTQSFRTSVGQRTNVTLPDGSLVTLNTDTLVRTRADPNRRLVYLVKGQAFFRVAKDPSRPFIVYAGGRTVTAVGTAFDVRLDQKGFKVTLVEGKVRVATPVPAVKTGLIQPEPAIQTTDIVAGSQLVAPDEAGWSVKRMDVVKATSWVHDQLIFQAEPLGDVTAEMNRYSVRQIIIADAGLATRPVSGNFRPGDVESFVSAVEAYGFARVASETPSEIVLVSAEHAP